MAWIFDLEQLVNCHTFTGLELHTEKIVQYVIHTRRDDRREYIDFLQGKTELTNFTIPLLIGFNAIHYDYPLLHHGLSGAFWDVNPNKSLYQKSQSLISAHKGYMNIIRPEDRFLHVVDLFKIWHFDNPARSTDLKSLMCAMDWWNVQEMPIHHSSLVAEHQIQEILDYNLNDVYATYEFYKRSKDKIQLRKDFKKIYKIPEIINMSDSTIGEKIIMKFYCEETGRSEEHVMESRPSYTEIKIKDCVDSTLRDRINSSNDPGLKKILAFFDGLRIHPDQMRTDDKGSKKLKFFWHGLEFVFALGGVHASKSGVFKALKGRLLKDADVKSLYPNLPDAFNFWPVHMGQIFLKVYKGKIVGVRMAELTKPKELQNKSLVGGLKLAANCTYGKSNSVYSPLYDPMYTMKTTINGQLSLAIFVSELMAIKSAKLIQANTDGVTIDIAETDYGQYNNICLEWQARTNLQLEYTDYDLMYIGDVNNYGARKTDGKWKHKGRFELKHERWGKGENPAAPYKDFSHMIIPLAVHEYFDKGTPVEETILNHTDFYDFMGRMKIKRGDSAVIKYDTGLMEGMEMDCQRVTRYYVSNNGGRLIKTFSESGKRTRIESKYLVTVVNQVHDTKIPSDLNYNYYIRQARKEITLIEHVDSQLKLF